MATKQQAEDLQTVLCGCTGDDWHQLAAEGCTVEVKPATWGSWKPPSTGYRLPRYPVAEILGELAQHAPDRATRDRYRHQAATIRHAAKY